MAKFEPLTEARLVAALRKAGFITREAVQDELAKYHVGQVKPELEELRKELISAINKLLAGQQEIKRQLNDLKADAPTQKEFEELKSKVDRHHPTN